MTDSKPITLTVAHINDTHSYFEPTALSLNGRYISLGGFARIATRAAQLRTQAQQQQRGFLFLHAGDCFQGTLFFSLFKGEANAELLNALQIDAMTLGNHELDVSNELVAQFIRRINFPLLAGNWDLSNERQDKNFCMANNSNLFSFNAKNKRADWIIKEVDAEPIAIFGLSIDKMIEIANPDPDTPFVNSLMTAKNTVQAIREQGINKIILLSHLGYEADIELAKKVTGISLIVGGHSHHLQGDFSSFGLSKEDDYGFLVNDTFIVQAGYHAMALGHCHIDFAADGKVTAFNGRNELLFGRDVFVDAHLTQRLNKAECHSFHQQLIKQPNILICQKDQAVLELLQTRYLPKVEQWRQQIIAYSNRTWRHIRIPDQQGGSEIAPLVAESFHYQMNQQGLNVDFAIHNAGGVRNSLPIGAVSIADIAGRLLPFTIPVGVYQVTGAVIADILEGAINNAINNGVVGTGSGSYPYCYGLTFDYVANNLPGERIINLKINHCQEGWCLVDKSRYYRGSSSIYTMKGKEGYEALLNRQEEITTPFVLADCFIEWLKVFPQRLSVR